ncbi:MAG: FCD domain-containing protein [Paracoccus sp. (in: a-proteobacteria)]|uniref:FCD domain-containing protein n=1 Tax=Paracoccus sp. TaxID=267 RepID=UPI0026DF595B|nr:FCD domain-containing protein [Paracoccus sp. (in: a-proteobacteria)]MDO5631602.1 FCD domain-containing protein [Paracoccus sp. (in: a-proteobacteria)]
MLNAVPVRKKRLYEDVVAQIEASIVDGSLKPGDFLPAERELCERFEVSRTAIREALFALQTSGLIELVNGRRARIIEPTAERLIEELSGPARFVLTRPERLRQLQEARMMFEGFLARTAARMATADQLAAIQAALDANGQTINDPEAFVRTNIDFHLAIANVSGNVFIDALHNAVQAWLTAHRRVAIQAPGAAKRAFARHREIFDAIKDRNADAAEAAMTAHLQESIDAYWAVVA